MQKDSKGSWGFDLKSIDKSVRPQDDFYRYANGGWLKQAKIPKEESRWGSFTILRYNTEEQLQTLIVKLLKKKKYTGGRSEQLVSDMYRSASDMAARNKLGATPLSPLRAMVSAIASKEDLFTCIAHFHVLGVSGMFGTMIDQDSKDSTKYLLHLWQGGIGLPDREYYLADTAEHKRVREAYIVHIQKLLKLAKKTPAEIKHVVDTVMKIETALAKASMRKEDTRDAEKIYHKYSAVQLSRLAPNIPWHKYFALTGAKGITTTIVGQPDFFKKLSELTDSISLAQWRVYLEWHLINDAAPLLSEPFVRENFNFFGTVLSGSKKMKPVWRRALGATSSVVGEALGQLYIKEYFPQAAKKAMDILVSDLFAVYESRIKKLDWMGAATKRKAVQKLRMMKRKIGYPTKWKGYRGLTMAPNDFFGNILRSSEYEHIREMEKLKHAVDRTEWHMTPQTVNAYCNFNMNEIVFPAAILQWPFFDFTADDAINYAAIGSVIGHEMTHGFDDQGAKFDGKGNMKSWWTKKDNALFEKKSRILVEQYNVYEAASGINVNGQLTLGENIADLGGLAIAFDAYQKRLQKTGRKLLNGLSPEERFFLGFAQMERELAREESVKTRALTDPHSPAPARVNGPLANFLPFYEIFKVIKKDKLYREPKKLAEVW